MRDKPSTPEGAPSLTRCPGQTPRVASTRDHDRKQLRAPKGRYRYPPQRGRQGTAFSLYIYLLQGVRLEPLLVVVMRLKPAHQSAEDW